MQALRSVRRQDRPVKRIAVAAVATCAISPVLFIGLVAAAVSSGPAPIRSTSRGIESIEGVDPTVLALVSDATGVALTLHPGCDADPILVLAHMSIEWPPGLLGSARDVPMAANGDFRPIVQAYAPVPGADTDGGSFDGSATAEYAVGPLQQINAFRVTYSLDGNADGTVDQNNLSDATAMAVAHACAVQDKSGLSLQSPEGRRYEAGHYMLPAAPTSPAAADYGRLVDEAYERLAASAVFSSPLAGAGDHVLPVDPSTITDPSVLLSKHHDYPSWDLPVPTGTTAYAATSGTVVSAGWIGDCGNGVIFDGDDGARYTYCHGIDVLVGAGDQLEIGQPILITGSTGNSSGPHLHFQIEVDGQLVCPQPLLVDWSAGADRPPSEAPPTGCFY